MNRTQLDDHAPAQPERQVALELAVRACIDASAAEIRKTAEVFYDFLTADAPSQPVRIGDAHIRLVVDGVDLAGVVRDGLDRHSRFGDAAR